VIRVAGEVREATAVVALETTLIAHGFPAGEGVEVGLESERRVRDAGAVPATVGVLDGEIVVGLSEDELHRYDESARKAGPRDLAACAAQRAIGATTVGGTLAVCRRVGIRFMGTGGIGGVHRGWQKHPDVSADLGELARCQAVVVSAGAKSLLDVSATFELLETLGVPVLGWRTDTLPRFYTAGGGPPVSARVDSVSDVAQIAATHWDELERGGILVARPPDDGLDQVEPLIDVAVRAAEMEGVSGPQVTPFVLSYLHRGSGGETMRVNKELVAANAGLAAEIAVAYARREDG
jgi:pseudouridylate synthase